MTITRRRFMQGAAALGAASLAHGFDEWARHLGASEASRVGGFGPLRPTRDEATGLELLELPEGFRYTSFGWTGDKLSDGSPTPDSHDGMAVIASDGDTVTLCRNHEVNGSGAAFGGAGSA
jgi:secreted PhoX family phosphatase